MKKTILTLTLTLLTYSSYGQVAACQTMEQAQAAYNKSKAQAIAVRDTASQQLQCHYWQLGVFYQQLDTTNQQKAKDIQQAQKTLQQVQKDQQQIDFDKALKEREAQCVVVCNDDELDQFLEVLIQSMECGSYESVKHDVKKVHTNRSGGHDDTNPGGGGNDNGYNNPGFEHFNKK